MKILLAHDDTPLMSSGETAMVFQLEKEFKHMGHNVKIMGLSENKNSYRLGNKYYIGSFSFPIYPGVRQTFIRNDKYIEALIRWKPDIIHVHTEFSAAAICRKIAKKTNAPLIMTMHTDFRKMYFRGCEDSKPVKLIFKTWSKFVHRGAKILTVPSKKAEANALFCDPPCPVQIADNGIDIDIFRKPLTDTEKNSLMKRYGISHEDKVLVIVSRLSKEKRIQDILDMMPILIKKDPGIKLLLAGDGPYSDKLKSKALALGLKSNVIFTGHIARDEVYKYYKLGKIFLCASDFEHSSLTLREALACGLPCICLADEFLKGLLDDRINGMIYHSPKEFIRCVFKLLNDNELYEKMSREAIKKSAEFSMNNSAECFLKIYRHCLNR